MWPASPSRSALAGAGAAAGPDSAPEAVRRALTAVGEEAQVIILFAASDLGPDRVAAQAQAAAGSVPVVGLTSDACIGAPGVVRGGCSALALASPLRVGIAVATEADHDPYEAGRSAAAKALADLDAATEHAVLLLFVDARSGDQADTVAGAYAVAGGAIPFAGGAAAGDPSGQIAHGVVHERAVVAVAIASDAPIGVGMAHGARPRSIPCVVTSSSGRTVRAINGRAARDVYLEKLGLRPEDPVPDFAGLAAGHPLAQPELSGDVRLRHVLAVDADGGLEMATHIPANAAIHVTDQTVGDIVASTHDAVAGARARLGGERVRAALIFDCAGRKHVLGGSLDAEAREIIGAFGGEHAPPLAGLYTRGEIGRIRGAKGDRNHALVVVAFA